MSGTLGKDIEPQRVEPHKILVQFNTDQTHWIGQINLLVSSLTTELEKSQAECAALQEQVNELKRKTEKK